MAITINGTTGLAGVDGSAGTPAVQGADTNTGIFFPAADTIAFSEGGTEVARFDSSGNFGIGTTAPQARLHESSTNDGVQAIFTGAQTGTTQTILLRSQYHTNNGTAGFANIGWIDNGSQGGSLTLGTASNGGGTTGIPTERMRINSSGNVLVTSVAGLGYGTGSGGTVTQATSKATGVTLDKPTGQITMNAAALAAGAEVSFTLTNSVIAATDVVVVSIASGATAGAYSVECDATAAGSCRISVGNRSTGSLSETLVLNFAIIKGATS